MATIRFRAQIGGMNALEKCMQPLRFLFANADAKGVGLAEKAINDYQSSFPTPDLQMVALHILHQEVTAIWDKSSSRQTTFANLVFACIDNRLQALNAREACLMSPNDDDRPTCSSCKVEMLRGIAEPIVPGYEIRNFECPSCGNVLKLVACAIPR